MPEEPSEEEIKEVYARFGLAYYFSEVLHRGLCNVYALAPFEDEKDVTRMRIDERLEFAWSTTLGQMVNEIDDTVLSENVVGELDEAVDRRNFLAHYFWFERIPKINSRSGIQEMLSELDDYIEMFRSLDEEISSQLRHHAHNLGITEEVINEAMEEVLSGAERESLHDQRKPEKQERLVAAYKAPVQGRKAIILQTRDGELWQLSDVGLAWSPFDEPGDDWEDDERIMSYLPATISPRPEISSPFNYSIELSGGVLQVAKQNDKVVWTIEEVE